MGLQVGKGGKVSTGDELWKQWCSGKRNSSPRRHTASSMDADTTDLSVWSLNLEQRREKLKVWQKELVEPHIEHFAEAMRSYQQAADDLEKLQAGSKIEIVGNATIIGCTTISAAKNSDLLTSLCPTTIIVEEAAEILEAHILTTLQPSVKRLVMIGDHKQLRPKLECFTLRKESGEGINFDESLFERLALQEDFPVQVLNIQHRMRPEISTLVRETTYPELIDAPGVKNREHILGLASDVVFISHSEYETGDEDHAAIATSSKVNEFEADMVVGVTKYLLQQGYNTDDIVILTPYLGQMALIQRKLKQMKINALIGEKDKAELVRANAGEILNGDTATPASSCVRVATVDNYQGEEYKIVIASLVRSNVESNIGFLSGPERVNVLFSRARDGFILVGNADTLRNAKNNRRGRDLWSGVLDRLNASDSIRPGLPVICQRHKEAAVTHVCKPQDFAAICPEGGCHLPCGKQLPCGHICPRPCHPPFTDDAHDHVVCQETVEETCAFGHPVKRICSRSEPFACKMKVSMDCPEGHKCVRQCFQDSSLCRLCMKMEDEAKKQYNQELAQDEALIHALEKHLVSQSKLQRASDTTMHLDKLRQIEEASRRAELQAKNLLDNNQPLRTGLGAYSSGQSSTPLTAAAAAAAFPSSRPFNICTATDSNPTPTVAGGTKGFGEHLFTKHPEQWDYEGMKQGFAGTCDVIQPALTAQHKNTPGYPGYDFHTAAFGRCFPESSNLNTEMNMDLLASYCQTNETNTVDTAEKSILVNFCESRIEILQSHVNAANVLIGWEERGIEVHFSVHPYLLGIGIGSLGEKDSRHFDCIVSYLPYTMCSTGDIGKVVESSLRLLNASGDIHLVLTTGTSAETVQFPGYKHRLVEETDAGVVTYLLEPITASISDSGSSISSITPSISIIEAADRNRLNCNEQRRLHARILVTMIAVEEGYRALYDVFQVTPPLCTPQPFIPLTFKLTVHLLPLRWPT